MVITNSLQTLALAYETKSDFSQALTIWQKILSLNPNHLEATQKIYWLKTDVAQDCVKSGDKLNKEGKIKESVEFYQQALILNPQQPMPTYRTFVNNLITLCRFEEAETAFQELIKVYPELPDGYDGYARVANRFADWKSALKRWSEASIKFPKNIRFQFEKGNALINLSRFYEAEAIFQELKEKYPNHPQCYERYARLTHNIGDWKLALERWSEATLKFPNNIDFQFEKGNTLINLSRFDEADAIFQELKEKYPNHPQCYERYARLTHNIGDWELALERWSETTLKFPNNIDFQFEKGNALINLSRFDEAEAIFEKLKQKYPNHPQSYHGYGRLNHHIGDWESALKRWSEATLKFPNNINFQVQKGNALMNLLRVDKAEAVFQQLKEKYPNRPEGYDGYGRVANHFRNWKLALERWSEATLKFPNNINFQVQKGNALMNLVRVDEAEAVFQQLKEKYPNQPEGYDGYARVAQNLSDWELAFKRWENAIAQFPDNFDFRISQINVVILGNLEKWSQVYDNFSTSLLTIKGFVTFKKLCTLMLSSPISFGYNNKNEDNTKKYISLINVIYERFVSFFVSTCNNPQEKSKIIDYFIRYIEKVINQLVLPSSSKQLVDLYNILADLYYYKENTKLFKLYKTLNLIISETQNVSFTEELITTARKVNVNGQVIVLYLSNAYYSFFPMWYKYFRLHGLNNLIIVALDSIVYHRLEKFGISNQNLVLLDIFKAQPKFALRFFQYRIEIVAQMVFSGYSVITTGVDAIWLKNPLEHKALKTLEPDVMGGMAPGTTLKIRDKWKKGFVINCDLWLIKSNRQTISLAEKMLDILKDNPNYHDQDVLAYAIDSKYPNLQWKQEKNYFLFTDSEQTILVLDQTIISRFRSHSLNSYILHWPLFGIGSSRAEQLKNKLRSLGLEP